MSAKVYLVLRSGEDEVLADVFSTPEKARNFVLDYFEDVIQYMEVYEGRCDDGDTAEDAVKKWAGDEELSISGEGIFVSLEAQDVK